MTPVVLAASTAVDPDVTGGAAGPEDEDAIIGLLEKIVGYIQIIVLLVAIAYIIMAGYGWITAEGDAEKATTARQRLIYGLIGIAVVLFSYVAVDFVSSFIQG